jgi:ankyrin repeat protein
MALCSSDAEEMQLILNYDLLYMILTEYMDKDQDILNFILANKLYHRLFYDSLIRHNVLCGGCSALEWAARRGNLDLARAVLTVPKVEECASHGIWLKILDIAQDLENVDLARLLFQVNLVQTCVNNEASEIAIKGAETWIERQFKDSWLKRMWYAVDLGKEDLVELYLSHGMTVELSDQRGCTVLHRATEGRQKEQLVKLLLEKYQADPNRDILSRNGISPMARRPLVNAAEEGSLEVVKLLLSHGADPCHGGPATFCQALGAATCFGRKDVVKVLLQDERIELNVQDNRGHTILGYAVASADLGMVNIFLENNRIDPNYRERDGRSPLLLAIMGETLSGYIPWKPAASNFEIIKLLLSNERVDVSIKDSQGCNALSLAAQGHRHEVLKMLLDSGKVDPNEGDLTLRTPAMYAANSSVTESLRLLIDDTRVDLNRVDEKGRTALMWTAFNSRLDNMKLLLNSGRVDVDQVDLDRSTTLMLACCWLSDAGAVRLLLDTGGVDLNKRNANGETALMKAAQWAADPYGRKMQPALDAIKMILDTGHDLVNIKDNEGVAIIEHAVRTGIKEAVELLLGTGKVVVTPGATELAQENSDILDMLIKYSKDD